MQIHFILIFLVVSIFIKVWHFLFQFLRLIVCFPVEFEEEEPVQASIEHQDEVETQRVSTGWMNQSYAAMGEDKKELAMK